MKLFIALFMFVAVSANAKTLTTFNCKAKENGKTVSIRFLVENLYSHATLGVLPGGNEDEPVVVKPDSSPIHQLNENLSFRDIKDGQLHIDGDADGFYRVDLILYENSGFEKGFVKVEGDENLYSKVSCKLTTK